MLRGAEERKNFYLGEVGDTEGDGDPGRRQRLLIVAFTPDGEFGPVAAIGPAGVFGDGRRGVSLSFLEQPDQFDGQLVRVDGGGSGPLTIGNDPDPRSSITTPNTATRCQ